MHENVGSIPGSGRSPGEGNGNPLQHSCLDSRDRGAWQAAAHGITSRSRLSDLNLHQDSLHRWKLAYKIWEFSMVILLCRGEKKEVILKERKMKPKHSEIEKWNEDSTRRVSVSLFYLFQRSDCILDHPMTCLLFTLSLDIIKFPCKFLTHSFSSSVRPLPKSERFLTNKLLVPFIIAWWMLFPQRSQNSL